VNGKNNAIKNKLVESSKKKIALPRSSKPNATRAPVLPMMKYIYKPTSIGSLEANKNTVKFTETPRRILAIENLLLRLSHKLVSESMAQAN
jgi:hypothetical protein